MNVLGLALGLVLAQSGVDGPPSAAALQQMVDETLPKVAKVMGAEGKKVPVKVVSRRAAAKKIRAVIEREYPGDALERLGTALKLIHLVEADVDFPKRVAEAYSTHVSGFYDATDRALYLIDDVPRYGQEEIVPHELAHAVQDQMIGLDRASLARRDSEDAQLAMLSAVEGNAQAVAAAVRGRSAGRWTRKDPVGESASAPAGEAGVPRWLALQLQFPYLAGEILVKAVATPQDPSAVALVTRLPRSTAQVLEPPLYQQDEQPLQGTVGLVDRLPGAMAVRSTVLGRANIELLEQGLGVGWRGDRLEVAKVGGVACGAWVVAYAKPAQAERFAAVYAGLLGAAVNTRVGRAGKTVSGVWQRDGVVVVLERVPREKADELEAAARQALH